MAKSPPWGGKSPAPVPTPAQGTGLGSLLQLAELQLPGELFPRSSNDRNAAPQLCPPFSQAGSEVLSPSSSFCNPTAHPTHTRLLPPGAEQLTGDARGRAAPVPPQNVTRGPGADALSAADATFTAPRRRQSSAQLAASLHGELEPGWAARGGEGPRPSLETSHAAGALGCGTIEAFPAPGQRQRHRQQSQVARAAQLIPPMDNGVPESGAALRDGTRGQQEGSAAPHNPLLLPERCLRCG